jgi:THO complex subunit 5
MKDQIKDSLLKKISMKEKYKRGLLICSSLKKFNRASQIKVNKARIKTHEEKNKIDEYHLELQNLLYEISHLKKEINKCLEFRFYFKTS